MTKLTILAAVLVLLGCEATEAVRVRSAQLAPGARADPVERLAPEG